VFDPSGDIRAEIYNPKQSAFWRGLAEAAARAGVFEPDVDLDLLLRAMNRTSAAALLEWVVGELPSEKLAATARHGWALVLGGVAAPAWRERFRQKLQASQAEIRG
jgi:hypothetical protein